MKKQYLTGIIVPFVKHGCFALFAALSALAASRCVADTRTFANTGVVTINDSTQPFRIVPATPYPATINVSGFPPAETIEKVTVTFHSLKHGTPDDIDILLVGPGGQNVIILSDAGGGFADPDVPITITLDDAAASGVPDNGPDEGSLACGTYRPGNFDEGADVFPAPAPTPSTATTLAAFAGTAPNGDWRLYLVDDEAFDGGSIADGWSLTIVSRTDLAFTDADWSAMGDFDGWVNATVADGAGNLYVGGEFTRVGNTPANGIAKWDGNTWSALGTGLNGPVWSLAVSGTSVYAGGEFSAAGAVSANHIAKWDGNAWSALGSGVGLESEPWDFVAAMVVIGTDVYAAGEFATAGGIEVAHIAKWNGNTWSALGEGLSGGLINLINSHVWALAVVGTDLYAGGEFTTAGGIPADYLAKWNGSAWSAVGSGMDDYVYALAVTGTDLYAGGDFNSAGGTAANYIARWNGSEWFALGAGVDDEVHALAVSGTDLYAGGRFSQAGGVSAYYVARWDGSAWSALGSGMDDYVNALAIIGPNLYVGGDFESAGDKDSAYLARANISVSSAAPGRFSNLAWSPATGFSCTFLDATPGQPYRIQRSPSLTAGSWTDLMNFTYSEPVVITDATAVGAANRFYRAITP